jgi:hypothetical protein
MPGSNRVLWYGTPRAFVYARNPHSPMVFTHSGIYAEDYGKCAGVQILWDETRDDFGGGGGHFRGLYDCRVPRGKRPD